jgi:hypothetical protein
MGMSRRIWGIFIVFGNAFIVFYLFKLFQTTISPTFLTSIGALRPNTASATINASAPSSLSAIGSGYKGSHNDTAVIRLPGSEYTRALIVPYTSKDSIAWVDKVSSKFDLKLYQVDNPSATLHPPTNKGHEVMVYLTYIIDNYDDLPDILIFTHAHRNAWHNPELLGFDAVEMVNRLNSERVMRLGYMNLRCAWDPGCPEWLHPYDEVELIGKQEQKVLAKVWPELFPFDTLPKALGQPCCAQFALSKERVLSIPPGRFVFFRDWLLRTPLTDYYSGRIWEFVWQYVFTGQSVVCPPEHACYCDGYGVCFGGEKPYAEFQNLQKQVKDYNAELDAILRDDRHSESKGNGSYAQPGLVRTVYLKERIMALNSEIDKRRSDALERGQVPENRAKEAV